MQIAGGGYNAPTIVAVAVHIGVTLIAAAVPVMRVGRIDPARTLRDE